jgi:diaminopimelate decarboxylase
MTNPQRLLATYGSPLYVYDLAEVDRAVGQLRAALPSGAVLYYSIKANPHPEVVARLRRGGCRAEVSSAGEVSVALGAGFTGTDLLYSGPAKTVAEIDHALRTDVGTFSVESVADLRRVAGAAARLGVTAQCLVRVNVPLTGASGIRMTGAAAHFGTHLGDIVDAPRRFADLPGGRIIGLHFFSLSNATDEDSLSTQALAAVTAAARVQDATGRRVSLLDLGGGFAAPYARPGRRPEYPRFASRIEPALDRYFPRWRHGEPVVAFESGRYLVGTGGSLICTATEWKAVGDQGFVLLDSGINHLGGLSGLGRLLPTAVPESAVLVEPARDAVATIVGPLCTPADVLGRQVRVDPATVPGPMIIPNVGAYGLTASLIGFLSRPAPTEVVIDGDTVVSVSQLQIARVPVGRADP